MTPDEVRKLVKELSVDLKYPVAEYRERSVVKILAWLVERELAREDDERARGVPYEFGLKKVIGRCSRK